MSDTDIVERPSPRFAETFCSQCGRQFGPGDHGFSHCDNHTPYSREAMVDRISEAMSDVHDMDTTFAQFAAAAYDAMAWIEFAKEKPALGQRYMATDGIARWLDMATSINDRNGSTWKFTGRTHTATHWHPIPELPQPKEIDNVG